MDELKIEGISLAPKSQECFMSFCKTYSSRIVFPGLKVFAFWDSGNVIPDFDDIPLYEFHYSSHLDYEHNCQEHLLNFKMFNQVLYKLAFNEDSNRKKIYEKHEKNKYEKAGYGYREYLLDNSHNLVNEVFRFFEWSAISWRIEDQLKQRLKSSYTETPLYEQFYDPIPFVSNINKFELFLPKNQNKAKINEALLEHDRMIIKLRLASLCNSYGFYLKYLAENKTGDKKTIYLLKAQIWEERRKNWLDSADYNLSHINNALIEYYKRAGFGKKATNRSELHKSNYEQVKAYIEKYAERFPRLSKTQIFEQLQKQAPRIVKYQNNITFKDPTTFIKHLSKIQKENLD